MFSNKITTFLMSSTETDPQKEVYFQREVPLDSSEEVLTINQKFECDVGCVVWDAALLLAKYLEFKTDELGIRSANVVELGAGTGFCGLMAATLGADVILTDLSYCLDIMQKNIKINRHLVGDRVVAKEFDWTQTDSQKEEFFDLSLDKIDLIIVSDCVYYQTSIKPLFDTIVWLSSKGATVLLSYEDRDDKQILIDEFFKSLEKKFKITEIGSEDLHPEYRSPDLHLYQFKQIL